MLAAVTVPRIQRTAPCIDIIFAVPHPVSHPLYFQLARRELARPTLLAETIENDAAILSVKGD